LRMRRRWQPSAVVGAERTQVMADTLKGRNKLITRASIAKASNELDKKLWETEVLPAERERDLDAREAAFQDELDRLKELFNKVQVVRLGEVDDVTPYFTSFLITFISVLIIHPIHCLIKS
jgi:hypothetical protein